ncbi:hypothetical protein HAX54_033377, partial [Datura stramonium]|nr:hypothetical protein [Datura stramonium]
MDHIVAAVIGPRALARLWAIINCCSWTPILGSTMGHNITAEAGPRALARLWVIMETLKIGYDPHGLNLFMERELPNFILYLVLYFELSLPMHSLPHGFGTKAPTYIFIL